MAKYHRLSCFLDIAPCLDRVSKVLSINHLSQSLSRDNESHFHKNSNYVPRSTCHEKSGSRGAGQSTAMSELKFCSPKVRDRRRVWLSEIVGLVGGQWSVTRKIVVCGDIWKLRYIHYCLKTGCNLYLGADECWTHCLFSRYVAPNKMQGHFCDICFWYSCSCSIMW